MQKSWRALARGVLLLFLLWQLPNSLRQKTFPLAVYSLLPWQDVPREHWAYPYLLDAHREGILKGKTKTKFGGEEPLSRYEASEAISHFLHWFQNHLQKSR